MLSDLMTIEINAPDLVLPLSKQLAFHDSGQRKGRPWAGLWSRSEACGFSVGRTGFGSTSALRLRGLFLPKDREEKGKGLREAVLLATVSLESCGSCLWSRRLATAGRTDLISHNSTGQPMQSKATGKPLKASHRARASGRDFIKTQRQKPPR